MSTSEGYFSDLSAAIGRGWNRYWFTPVDPLPCSILRIAVGVAVIAWLLSLGADIDRWFARDGLLSPQVVKNLTLEGAQEAAYYRLSYFDYLGPSEARIAHYVAIVVACAFTLGALTRVTGALTAIAILSYIHRMPVALGHAEPILVFLVGYLCIAPAGAYWSVDRWIASLRAKTPPPPPAPSLLANLSLRSIQVHMAMFVAMMGLVKLWGDAWWDGLAIWNLLAQTMSRPLDLTSLRGWEYLINFWTHSVVYYELAFPLLIWNRTARPLVLGLGVLVWGSLVLVTGLAIFGLALVIAMLAFVPADAFRSLAARSTVPGAEIAKLRSAA
jgi:hypothetical protein